MGQIQKKKNKLICIIVCVKKVSVMMFPLILYQIAELLSDV